MKKRVINFNAGPAALPESVLIEAETNLLNYQNTGMSVMEMSHRSKAFEDIRNTAEQSIRQILTIPDNYEVLFLQGGASLQFAMLPLNLGQTKRQVDMIHTGSWTKKAIAEHQKITNVNIIASSEADNFLRLPTMDDIQSSDSDYTYLCSNNTIFGTQFKMFPFSNKSPLVADMSSDILSRQLNINEFGVIFAGAQKNIGPSGVTLVIIRKDLVERCPDTVPSILQYRTHAKNNSLYNTPPTFGIYMCGLVFKWIQNQGGLNVVEEHNDLKAKVLYEAIDNLDLYYCPVEKSSRSTMNVVFRIQGNQVELENKFIQEAQEAGIVGIKGHRSVGGLRASIYNAQTRENIKAFIEFMETFQQNNH